MNPPRIMGIINVTPDSFSGDGLLLSNDYVAEALRQAEDMMSHGADILDIGGESSRPGSTRVTAQEEKRRVVPVIKAIKAKLGDIPIAVDTVKADVAEEAVKAGAVIINDISALQGDARMAAVAARHGVKIILMHNRSAADKVRFNARTGGRYEAPSYRDVVADVISDLRMRIDEALKAGIRKDRIVLDPGIGFGKTPEQNLALISQLKRIKKLGFPVLMGLSRKSFIGDVLDTPVDERLEGTAAGVAISVIQGADILRVHDVKFMARVVKMAAALRDAA